MRYPRKRPRTRTTGFASFRRNANIGPISLFHQQLDTIEGLVHDQHAGRTRDGACDLEPTPLAAAKLETSSSNPQIKPTARLELHIQPDVGQRRGKDRTREGRAQLKIVSYGA